MSNKLAKKREKNLVKHLTAVCEIAKYEFHGFAWLTHIMDASLSPDSLKVVCVFETRADISNLKQTDGHYSLQQMVEGALSSSGFDALNAAQHIHLDSEDNSASARWLS